MAKSYALRLKAVLPKLSPKNSGSSDELLPGRSSALLAQALKRSLILINVSDDSSIRVPSGLPSKTPETLPSRKINQDSVAEQESKTQTGSSASLEDIDSMILKNPTTESAEKNLKKLSQRGIGFATKRHGYELSLFSPDLPTLSEIGQWASQGNPQKYDDLLQSAGNTLALAYNDSCGELKARVSLAAWIFRLSLAGEEHSVNNTRLAVCNMCLLTFRLGCHYESCGGRIPCGVRKKTAKS